MLASETGLKLPIVGLRVMSRLELHDLVHGGVGYFPPQFYRRRSIMRKIVEISSIEGHILSFCSGAHMFVLR